MKPTNIIWSDEIAQMLEIRKISLHNIEENSYFKTQNKTIMDLANEYIDLQNLDKEMHVVLNQVHLYKQMNLLCKLVGLRGNREIEAYRKDGALSCLKWSITHPRVLKPSKKSFNCWNQFKIWLKQ